MGKIKIRYFIQKGKNYYWQPSTKLRALGWEAVNLGESRSAAITLADEQNAKLDAWRKGEVEVPDVKMDNRNTVSYWVQRYTHSPSFENLAPNTKDDYQYKLSIITEWAGDIPVTAITRADVKDFYEQLCKKKSLRMGGAVISILRLLLQYVVDYGQLQLNPASRPKTVAALPRDTVWSYEEEDVMVETADELGYKSFGTSIIFAAYLGQRRADILKLSWNTYINGAFRLKQHKTKRIVEVPAHKKLKERIKYLTPTVGDVIIKAEFNGKPMDPNYFSHVFAKIRKEAAKKLPSCRRLKFLDLRRTAVVRLAECGCTEAEIAAVTGHKIDTCRRILETYLPRTTKMAQNAIHKLEA